MPENHETHARGPSLVLEEVGGRSRTGEAMCCDDVITAFDTKNEPLDEAASEFVRIRLRLDGVKRLGSMFASMRRFEGVVCALGVGEDGSRGDEGRPGLPTEPSARGERCALASISNCVAG